MSEREEEEKNSLRARGGESQRERTTKTKKEKRISSFNDSKMTGLLSGHSGLSTKCSAAMIGIVSYLLLPGSDLLFSFQKTKEQLVPIDILHRD